MSFAASSQHSAERFCLSVMHKFDPAMNLYLDANGGTASLIKIDLPR